jgi:hypothetical protein
MSFAFSFNGNTREKLHRLADQQSAYPHVPKAAVDFVKHAIDTFPDGTMLKVQAHGHKPHWNEHSHGPTTPPASMSISVEPIFPSE